MSLSENLRRKREEYELTYEQLAQRVGTTPVMVRYVEQGLRAPSLALTVRLAKALNCTVDELVGE